MAIIYDNHGITSLTDRDVVFEKGSPTDPDKWDNFKSIIEDIKMRSGLKTEITIDLINDVFSRVKDPGTGRVLRSALDQFKIFCDGNNLLVHEREDFSSVIVEYNVE